MRSRRALGLVLTLGVVAMCAVPGDAVAQRARFSTDTQNRLLLSDMTHPSEKLPAGVPGWWDWARHPRTRPIAPLRRFGAFTAWGQLYQCAGTTSTPRATTQLRDLQAWVLLRGSSRWRRIQFSSDLGGAAFAENYAGPVAPGRYSASSTDTSVHMVTGHNFHFWPDAGRVAINASRIAAITVALEARLGATPRHTRMPCLVVSVGGDMWKSVTAVAGSSASDVGIGRFKRVEDSWRLFTMTTASAAVLRRSPLPPLAPAADEF